jgi:AGCS family alanine or glycine:cation symporter
MLTGLVLLSSGVWKEKYSNNFQMADIEILEKQLDANGKNQVKLLQNHLSGVEKLPSFNGELLVVDGIIQNHLTVLHARSIAEDVKVYEKSELFTGTLQVNNGKLNFTKSADYKTITLVGKSLLHSAPLTTEAFKRSFLGDFGQYIVAIGLLLFAFSTAISWSYYGDRAMTYLFGTKSVIYYRIVYVIGFFFAAFTDTTIIWTLSGITIALMTIPNLVGIFMLRKEMKTTIKTYWEDFEKESNKLE